jgi:ubiquinone/menaquinone biosynthesis C-methylase UbiE|tara:strand:- start:4314 stop:5300 length:987 start_codon:yes stop_codon:yes gene_type:complete
MTIPNKTLLDILVCPISKTPLKYDEEANELVSVEAGHAYPVEDGIPILLPPKLDEFKKLEAEYHDTESDSYDEINMLSSYRVVYHHEKYLEHLKGLPAGSIVLEVGGGDGTDASKLLDSELIVIQSDISFGMVKKAKTKASSEQINSSAFHVVCDAEQIPCESGSVDAVIIVAALHHLPSPEIFFKEVNRVLKSGGLLVVGFEPNTWPYFFIYPFLKRVGQLLGVRKRFKYTEISIADQETNGFNEKDLRFFLQAGNLEIVELQRVWFLNGFIHMVLSSINSKFFSKDKKIDLPIFAQKIIIKFDNLISHIPLFRRFCWHWTLIAKKL